MSEEEAARALLEAGDLISAYDAVKQAEPTAASAYLEVLILARLGETDEAIRRYDELELGDSSDVDALALRGRLAKDRALQTTGARRAALIDEAGRLYLEAFRKTNSYFPGINAATLACAGGKFETGRALAESVLALGEIDQPQDYFAAASRAEALVILGDVAAAEATLAQAKLLPGANKGARSTTARQLSWLCSCLGVDPALASSLLIPIRSPCVAAYSGHIFKPDPVAEGILGDQIDAALEKHDIGLGFGALAAGGDILIAEHILKRGGEVHVVLPFEEKDFIEQSVLPAGQSWVERYHAVRSKASSVTIAAAGGFLGDDMQFAFGSRFAMGLARLRAESLGSRVVQLAIWNGRSQGVAGTGHDISQWQRTGLDQVIIRPPALDRVKPKNPSKTRNRRLLRAMLFADFPGFSRLPERAIPLFWQKVMGAVSEILDRHAGLVSTANSWGDAIFVTFESIEAALLVGSDINRALSSLNYRHLGMGDSSGMRMAMHFGPVFEATDPITGRPTFYGSEVSRTARIEPITPPGTIFVTEAFAAISTSHAQSRFRYAYVGKLELPKDAGMVRLYKVQQER